MIEADAADFPQNIVQVTIDRIKPAIDPDLFVTSRPLRNTDPNQSVGVFGNLWQPDLDSFEMGRGRDPGPQEPTLNVYTVGIQAFIKDMDEERGSVVHSVLAKRLRTMLYHDTPLRVGLASLESTSGSFTERAKRWGVRNQRLLSSELEGSWLYLSTLEFWLETETR